MDVAIFSKCLKDLLLQHEEVAVPGLGVFLAQTVHAKESSDGTFTPPQRKITFSPAYKEDDGLFLRFLKRYLPAGSDAEKQLQSFVMDLTLDTDISRPVALPGLGTLKANARKTLYFVPTEDIFVYPESLQGEGEPNAGYDAADADYAADTTADAAAEAAPAAAETIAPGSDAPAGNAAAVEAEAAGPASGSTAQTSRRESADSPRSIIIGNCLLICFVLLIFAMIAVTLFKDTPWMSNLLDHLLYTREELEILGK